MLLFFLCCSIFNDIHTACGFVIITLVAKWILIDHVNIVKLDAFRMTNSRTWLIVNIIFTSHLYIIDYQQCLM